MPSRQRRRSSPPFLTGMTIEITRGATVARVVIWAVDRHARPAATLLRAVPRTRSRAQTRPPDRIARRRQRARATARPSWLAGRTDVEMLAPGGERGGAGGFHAGSSARTRAAPSGRGSWTTTRSPRPDALERAAAAADGPGADPARERRRVEGRPAAPDERARASSASGSSRSSRRRRSRRAAAAHRDVRLAARPPRRRRPLRPARGALLHLERRHRVHRPRHPRRRAGRSSCPTASSSTGRPSRTPPSRAPGDRFYFHARNTLYMVRGRSWGALEKVSLLYLLAVTSLQYLRAGGSAAVVLRGLRDGSTLTPAVPI